MIRPENPEYAASSERLRIAYPEELPITRHLDEIRRLWQEHPLIIVGGDTGSGKTTQLPKVALELGWGRFGRIGCTQPRRIAEKMPGALYSAQCTVSRHSFTPCSAHAAAISQKFAASLPQSAGAEFFFSRVSAWKV